MKAPLYILCLVSAFLFGTMTGFVISDVAMHNHAMRALQAASEAQDRALALNQKNGELETVLRSIIRSQEQIITSKSGSIDLLKGYAHEKDVEVDTLRKALVAKGGLEGPVQ